MASRKKKPSARDVAARKAQRAAEREECTVHAWALHGKEAEELRKGIETLVASITDEDGVDDLGADDARAELAGVRRALRKLLDDVDARDSLAYLERRDALRDDLVRHARRQHLSIGLIMRAFGFKSPEEACAAVERVARRDPVRA